MRAIVRSSFVGMAFVFGTASATAFGFGDFYFVRDSGNANELQVHTATSYDDVVPDPDETVAQSADSQIETDEADDDPAINDNHALSDCRAQTVIVPYGGTGMSVSGEIQSRFLARGDDDLFEATVGGAIGVAGGGYELNDPLDDCLYFGIIASDIYPTGQACTISGTVSMDWAYAGDADLLHQAGPRGGTINVYLGNTLIASISGGPGSAHVISGPTDMGHNVTTNATSDIVSVEFSVSAHVGDRVTVEYVLEDIFALALYVGDFIQDVVGCDVEIDVSAP
jgi:hypothetical protein